LFDEDEVSDNLARENAQGGMEASSFIGSNCDHVRGTANVAQNNGVFQCILIVCAKNPGQVGK
jgi:hypothetical protein